MAIPYVKQNWVDNNVANPLSAARLGVLETGIFDAHYMPAVRVTHNAAQTLTTAVALALAFNTERFDQASNAADTMHDTVTNNSRLTCRYAGVYHIFANGEFTPNATGYRKLTVRLNGTTDIGNEQSNVNTAGNSSIVNLSCLYSLAVNDYLELVALQNSGVNLNVLLTANTSPEFGMVRVG